MNSKTKVNPIYLYILVVVFLILIISLLGLVGLYVNKSTKNLAFFLKRDIDADLEERLSMAVDISSVISRNHNIKKIMEKEQYGKLNDANFFNNVKAYKAYKHIEIYIINKHGIYVFIPINKYGYKRTQEEYRAINKLLFSHRRQRVKNFNVEYKDYKCISISRDGIVFKGISPIYSDSKELLGFVEVNIYFNSVISELKKSGIDSVIVVAKKYSKLIKSASHGYMIDGYLISNEHIKPTIIGLLKKYGMKNLISAKMCKYVVPKNSMFNGYYLVSLPIKNDKGEVIAYYLGFFYDKYKLMEKKYLLYLIVTFIVFVFILTSYVGYRYRKMNKRLIASLDSRVRRQTVKIIELMYIDTLTGVYNKMKFDSDVEDVTSNTHIVMFNIRNFSKVNSTYGFEAGDKILKIVAKRVKNLISSPLYRIHADEFVFFAEEYEVDIKRIKEKFIREPIDIKEKNIRLRLSFSFGVCKNNTKDVLSKASIALKEAKHSPYSEFIIYKEHEINEDFLRFNSILYDALFQKKEATIVPYFQGIRNNKTGEIFKYEALARLVVEDKVYPPFYFLDVAKSSGFVYEITKAIMDSSMKYIYLNNLEVDLSINITEDDLSKGYLKEYILGLTQKYKIKPGRITFEILEGVTSSGTKNNIEKLKELKEFGVKLALDDFGVEYSNFERIAELDIDFIKIDGKYIKNITDSVKSRNIAKAITDFAHSIGIEVVAEFVDSQEIQKIVEELGIEYSQGYLFSIPDKEIKSG